MPLLILLETNECEENIDQCSQNCENTAGSYTCSCREGYTLSSNGRTCNGMLSYSNINADLEQQAI